MGRAHEPPVAGPGRHGPTSSCWPKTTKSQGMETLASSSPLATNPPPSAVQENHPGPAAPAPEWPPPGSPPHRPPQGLRPQDQPRGPPAPTTETPLANTTSQPPQRRPAAPQPTSSETAPPPCAATEHRRQEIPQRNHPSWCPGLLTEIFVFLRGAARPSRAPLRATPGRGALLLSTAPLAPADLAGTPRRRG